MEENVRCMLLSLDGLSTGDAFGEQFFKRSNQSLIAKKELPSGIWHWTDDTQMAISIVEMIKEEGTIQPDSLAKKFAYRFFKEPYRGYGRGAAQLLKMIEDGADWKEVSPRLFNGGSFGNGAAMRVAPLGAFFKDDFKKLVSEAKKSAMITHYHAEGQAGAIAVALAAALAARGDLQNTKIFFTEILKWTPESEVRNGIRLAGKIGKNERIRAVKELGTGSHISAQDTVPFSLWCAAHFGSSFEDALWTAVSEYGDLDTLGAIVGGIVALNTGKVPELWLAHREPLEK